MLTCVECGGIGQHIDTEIGVISCEFCGGIGEVTPLDLPPEQLTMRQLMNWHLRPEVQIYRYSTRIVFNTNPKLEFVEFTNPEKQQEPECDTTTMHSEPCHTKPLYNRYVKSSLQCETNNEYLFNVTSFSEIINLVNTVNPIVITFPDGSNWTTNACVSCFEPVAPYYLQPNIKGYLALANIRIDYYGVIEYSPVNPSSHFVGKLEG